MDVTWLANASASALHAACALLRGDVLFDVRLAELLDEPVDHLRAELDRLRLPAQAFFEHAIPLSAGIGNNAALAETALVKVAGRGAQGKASGLAQAIGQCETAYLAVHPRAADELALRIGPMREQWEARGPGVLFGVVRLTEPGLLVEQAQIMGLEPVLGGGGRAHPSYNMVSIEAVLANPHAGLPEVVRLAWLLAQLQLDVPRYQGEMARDRALHVGAIGLLPAVVAAAEEVELVGGREAAIETAIEAWRLEGVRSGPLLDWWDTYVADRPAWPVAVAALDRMLAS